LAAQPCAGAVQPWRRISGCTDWSASGCADRQYRCYRSCVSRCCPPDTPRQGAGSSAECLQPLGAATPLCNRTAQDTPRFRAICRVDGARQAVCGCSCDGRRAGQPAGPWRVDGPRGGTPARVAPRAYAGVGRRGDPPCHGTRPRREDRGSHLTRREPGSALIYMPQTGWTDSFFPLAWFGV